MFSNATGMSASLRKVKNMKAVELHVRIPSSAQKRTSMSQQSA